MAFPLLALAPALIAAGGALGGAAMGANSASKDRALNREAVRNQERMNKFQRLLSLIQTGQGMQSDLAGMERLRALRNSGGI